MSITRNLVRNFLDDIGVEECTKKIYFDEYHLNFNNLDSRINTLFSSITGTNNMESMVIRLYDGSMSLTYNEKYKCLYYYDIMKKSSLTNLKGLKLFILHGYRNED